MLEVARQAARWIRTTRIETPNGVTWSPKPEASDGEEPADSVAASLYYGTPGIVLFYLELFYATGEEAWLEEARAGAGEVIAQLSTLREAEDWGLYTGVAGSAFVLEAVHRATGVGRYRDAARRAVRWIHEDAQRTGAGVTWGGSNDIIRGSAGIGLLLLWADRQMDDPVSRKLAAAAGRLLLERGRPAAGNGLKWDYAPGAERLYPNFSHGTAGVAYFLATLYRATGERDFLEAAEAGAAYLQAVAHTSENGFKVFHHEPGGRELFYLGWCHGPVGTSRLFYRLAEITGEAPWTELTQQSARAIVESGIPEERTLGFWDNVSQCGGNAGVGEYFLALQRTMPDPTYEQMVHRVAKDTLRRATETHDGGLKWVQAEHRTLPDRRLAQTGFMQGAAGVGTFFLHVDALEEERSLPIAWPDAPFV